MRSGLIDSRCSSRFFNLDLRGVARVAGGMGYGACRAWRLVPEDCVASCLVLLLPDANAPETGLGRADR